MHSHCRRINFKLLSITLQQLCTSLISVLFRPVVVLAAYRIAAAGRSSSRLLRLDTPFLTQLLQRLGEEDCLVAIVQDLTTEITRQVRQQSHRSPEQRQ